MVAQAESGRAQVENTGAQRHGFTRNGLSQNGYGTELVARLRALASTLNPESEIGGWAHGPEHVDPSLWTRGRGPKAWSPG